MKPSIYTEEFRVLSPQVTWERRLKPSVAMQYFQELSDRHCDLVGNGYHTLKERNMAFISVLTSVTFHRSPSCGEVVKGKTWLQGQKGTQWLRDCVLMDSQGNICVCSTTAWVLVNLEDHKILRPNKVEGVVLITEPELALQESRMNRIALPEEMPSLGSKLVQYTDIDYFGHLNNCFYADILCNVVPGGMHHRTLKTLDIRFVNESICGDTIELFGEEQGAAFLLTGYHSRGKCFEARATIAPLEE